MLDHLRLAIPLNDDCYISTTYLNNKNQLQEEYWVTRDPIDFGFPMATRMVSKRDDGSYEVGALYSPYESLGSDFTPMAVKLYTNTTNCRPHVEIKGSPAKIMQGHNVFGSDDIEQCSFHMIGLLLSSIPQVAPYLDLPNTEVRHIDCTYSSPVKHPNHIPKIIDYLSRISNGQTKPTADKKYRTTAYWGGENSRLLQLKCYGKYAELLNQRKDFIKDAKKGDVNAQKILDDVYTDELMSYAANLLRWEARIKARKLERMNIPHKLIDLINYQHDNPTLIKDLWTTAFQPIFKTLEGKTMPYADDDAIKDMLKEKLTRHTKSGKKTDTDARNAYQLYSHIRQHGMVQAKDDYVKATFYRHLGFLVKAGLSKAWLQNLHTEQKGKVIPLVTFADIKFDQQAPAGYIPPVSQYQPFNKVA